jgi:hypothetical protein
METPKKRKKRKAGGTRIGTKRKGEGFQYRTTAFSTPDYFVFQK